MLKCATGVLAFAGHTLLAHNLSDLFPSFFQIVGEQCCPTGRRCSISRGVWQVFTSFVEKCFLSLTYSVSSI
jgi:hypothetical protein